MPYKNKELEKAYYHRHKKIYDKAWKAKNRESWNVYQKEFKTGQRIKLVNDIKEIVKEANISNEEDLTFKSAVIAILLLKNKISRWWAIAYRTGYTIEEVRIILNNWTEQRIYKNGEIEFEGWDTDLEFVIELTLIAMAGSGEVKRFQHQ